MVSIGARTDVGNVRAHNEDAFLTADPLFAVADGMGGHQGGEVASKVALDTLVGLHRQDADGLDLREAIRLANRAVLDRASEDESLEGMGTTLTVLRVEGRRIRLAHVGDSRAYLLRDGELRQLTEDHTLVHRMVREGKLTREEADIHPHRSILTRALGVDPEINVDHFDHDIGVGDRVLLCSDGLTSMVDEGRIEEILKEERDPQAACDRLVAMANEAGGQDNITVIVLDFVEDAAGAAPPADPVVETGTPTVVGKPAPPRVRRGVRWGRLAVWVGVALAVLAGAAVGARAWIDSQWFVGVSGADGVGLYRGIPREVLGFELYRLVEETGLSASDAAAAGRDWQELNEGITAESEREAREIVEQIRTDIEARQEGPERGP